MSSATRIARAILTVALVPIHVSVGGTSDMILQGMMVLRTHVHVPLRESERRL